MTASPVRVQLSRRAGWRMPANTVSVARPHRWGNPYRVGVECADRAEAAECFRAGMANARATTALARRELAGKNLACWCPLDQPCHADVLLEIANGDRA